jgi:hypothetical protein
MRSQQGYVATLASTCTRLFATLEPTPPLVPTLATQHPQRPPPRELAYQRTLDRPPR